MWKVHWDGRLSGARSGLARPKLHQVDERLGLCRKCMLGLCGIHFGGRLQDKKQGSRELSRVRTVQLNSINPKSWASAQARYAA